MQFLDHVRLIQGGMGIYVSNWKLARAAAMSAPGVIAGTVSGTALNAVYSRQLQLGDPGGNIKRAFAELDLLTGKDLGRNTYERYYIAGGKTPGSHFKQSPKPYLRSENGSSEFTINAGAAAEPVRLALDGGLVELLIASAFAEVWLAKQGHGGRIFINFLKKIEVPLIPSMYGAMLAGVDAVVVGAGNPDGLPEICSRLARHEEVSIEPSVLYKETGERFILPFDPKKYAGGAAGATQIHRPAFLAIVSLQDLAKALANSESTAPDGLIIENHTAGGHNANPVGPLKKDERGQPIYGEHDVADITTIKETGLPFWLGGGFDSKEKLQQALDKGANGIQAGSIYALSEESGINAGHRNAILNEIKNGKDDRSLVLTTMYSPTGFSFKVAELEGTLSEKSVYEKRRRVCDMGLLLQAGLGKPDENGMRRLFHRCPAAPVDNFVKKRGLLRNTEERRCLCNGLISGAGYGQIIRHDDGTMGSEPSILTIGEHLDGVRRMSLGGRQSYRCENIAADILG